MTLDPFRGVRVGRVVSPRVDEGPQSFRENPGEPSRRVRIDAQFRVQSVELQPSSDSRAPLTVFLQIQEEDWESGKDRNPAPPFFLSLPVEGKEVALLVGLIGRNIGVSGTVPERAWSYLQLEKAFQVLKERHENLLFVLEEISQLARTPGGIKAT